MRYGAGGGGAGTAAISDHTASLALSHSRWMALTQTFDLATKCHVQFWQQNCYSECSTTTTIMMCKHIGDGQSYKEVRQNVMSELFTWTLMTNTLIDNVRHLRQGSGPLL